MKIKLFFKKVKLWFIERWKEFQSIQRDKKEIKTMHQVNKVEFSKKHPTYTIVTRVIAVVILCIFSLFMLFSCFRSFDNLKDEKSVTASAESAPVTTNHSFAPAFVDIYIPSLSVYFYREDVGEGDGYYNQFIYDYGFPILQVDTQGSQITAFWDGEDYEDFDNFNDSSEFLLRGVDSTFNEFGFYCDNLFYLDSLEVELDYGDYLETFMSYEVSYFPSQDDFNITVILHALNGRAYYDFWLNNDAIVNYNLSFFGYSDSFVINQGLMDYSFELGYYYGGYMAYEDGYDVGYNDGYYEGLDVTLSDVTPWDVIVDGVNSFFGLSFLGNDVTIGLVLSCVFGCILIGFAIKIFLGG